MNRAVSLIIMIFLIFSFTGIAFSAEKNKKIQVFGGLITAINTEEKTITLKNDKIPEFTCVVDDKALKTNTNGKQSMADIRIGDIVAVVYEEVDGKNIAKGVTAMVPKASSSAGQSKPATSEGKN